LAGDLNAKHPFWNSAVSNHSGEKLMALFDLSEFEISAPQCPTNRFPAGNCYVLDIKVHQNIRAACDILEYDYLPIISHILDHIKFRNLSQPIQKFTDWYQFQSVTSELISPRTEINSGIEADKVACNITASIASAYKLATSKVTLSDINNDIPGLDWQLKHTRRLRKLWQETRDPACKKAVNWVTKSIRRMTREKALERWETKISNTEVTPQAIWPIAKSLIKKDGPRAPTAIRGPSGLKYHPSEKADAIADSLENQFTHHDLCDENHERRVEARVQTLLEALDSKPQRE
jgi:hypothetical protein